MFWYLSTNRRGPPENVFNFIFNVFFLYYSLWLFMYFPCSSRLLYKTCSYKIWKVHRKCQTFFLTTLLKSKLRHRCFPVNLTKFLRKSTLENISGRPPQCFVPFSGILVKKAFWMLLQYFRNRSCKLSLYIVRLL